MDAGYERDSGERYAGEEAVSGRTHDQTGGSRERTTGDQVESGQGEAARVVFTMVNGYKMS